MEMVDGEAESGGRSSDQVQDESTSHRAVTLQDLPDEIVSKVFTFVELKGLIHGCRLVSKRWKRISSEIFRNRFVSLKARWNDDEGKPDDILMLFDMDNLPWSSYSTDATSELTKEDTRFLELLGKHIRCLCMRGDQVVRILGYIPNVIRMEVCYGEREWTPSDLSFPPEGMDLSKLKRLELDRLNDWNTELLKLFIERGGARLDYFHSSITVEAVRNAGTVASLLHNVPYISLEVQYNSTLSPSFDVIVCKMEKLCIKKLLLVVNCYGDGYGFISREPAVRFIASHSGHLEKLDLTLDEPPCKPSTLPPMPSLTFLSIQYPYPPFCQYEPGSSFLSLQTNQFPILHEVHVGIWSDGENFYSHHRCFPDDCHFDSVSKLSFDCDLPLRDDWADIFPNLVSLDYKYARTVGAVRDIFSLQRLEDLTVTILLHDEEGADTIPLLSGIPNPEEVYDDDEPEYAIEVESRNLKNLKMDIQLDAEDVILVFVSRFFNSSHSNVSPYQMLFRFWSSAFGN